MNINGLDVGTRDLLRSRCEVSPARPFTRAKRQKAEVGVAGSEGEGSTGTGQNERNLGPSSFEQCLGSRK